MRQGRGPELAGRPQCGWLRCGVSVRTGLKEAIGVSWWRTRVKRRKASLEGEPSHSGDAQFLSISKVVVATRSRRNLSISPQEICWVPARKGR